MNKISQRLSFLHAGRRSLLAVALIAPFALPGQAQGEYPQRTLKIVVPYPAGAASDAMARAIAEKLQQSWGQPVIVENRPGASGTIGNQHVVRSPADGYTLLYSNTSLIQQPWMMSRLPYDPLKQLTPLVVVARANNALVVARKHSRATSVKELIELAKADPQNYSIGSWGIGSGAHINSEMLNRQAGLDMLHVPFQGASPLVINLLGGQVSAGFLDIPSLIPHIDAIRPLAIAGSQRLPSMPDVPTFAELGFKSFDSDGWHGLLLPAGTPAPVVQKLSLELNRILRLPDIAAKIQGFGMLPGGGTPEAYAQAMRVDSDIYAKVIKAANIRLD
jgi:tripartite-type tricarboxylate transporter receptor subunit TctC